MIKVQRIVKGTTATLLLAALGFVMIVWAHGISAPRGDTNSKKLVTLRLTFESGGWASVTEFEGGTITIEKNGKKLAITPYIREQGQVELRLFQAVQSTGKERMDSLSTLLIGKNLTKLDGGGLVTSVQVLATDKTVTSDVLAMSGVADCCVTTCNGTLVCGFCVCTDCKRCGPNWCECPQPPTDPGT
jgi:hypothetical protein